MFRPEFVVDDVKLYLSPFPLPKTTKTARSQLPFLHYAKNLDVTGALKEIATV